MSEYTTAIIIAALLSIVTAYVTARLNRNTTEARAQADSSEAAESLSNAAAKQIEIYQREIVTPMQQRIETLTEQLSVIEEDRFQEQLRAKQLQRESDARIKELSEKTTKLELQVEYMKGELRRADSALEYAVGVARETFPDQMGKAVRVRRGLENDWKESHGQ